MKVHKILINVDTILDTRMGCVKVINPDWVEPLVKNGYHDRKTNRLSSFCPIVDEKKVDERWATRDIEVLKLSQVTSIVPMLAERILEVQGREKDHPNYCEYQLTLNIGRYEIDDDDLADLITLLKELWMVPKIQVVRLGMSEISPSYLKSRFTQFIIEDIDDWNKYHLSALKALPITGVTCVAPLILLEPKNLSDDDLQDVVRGISQAYAAHMDLELVPLATMTFLRNEYPKDSSKS